MCGPVLIEPRTATGPSLYFFLVIPHSGNQKFNLVWCGTHDLFGLVSDILSQRGQSTFISIVRNKVYTDGFLRYKVKVHQFLTLHCTKSCRFSELIVRQQLIELSSSSRAGSIPCKYMMHLHGIEPARDQPFNNFLVSVLPQPILGQIWETFVIYKV